MSSLPSNNQSNPSSQSAETPPVPHLPENVPVHRRRSSPPALLIIALVLAVALVAASLSLVSGGITQSVPAGAGQMKQEPKVGSQAPDFELTNVATGRPVTLASLRGKPVWINFWATWCPPCKTEMPIMKEKYDKYKAQGLEVVGINMREDPAYVNAFVEGNGYDWLFVVDGDGAVTNRYFASGIPSHIFVDSAGTIQAIHIGDLQASTMEELLGKIIAH
jgi:thiol-disulfide isomerase/thioredoxin